MRHTKIEVPEGSPLLVDRAEVRRALDEAGAGATAGRVVLVSAPAGHGKTLAVADWVRRTAEVPTAWVSLDAADRAESRWWRTVLDALRACPGLPADSALQQNDLEFPDTDTAARSVFLASVLEALDELPGPLRLVVDDAHEVAGHPAQRALRDLVRYPVRGLTIVLCSRLDPPIGLDRLRLDGRLGELRVDRLAFTTGDATRLFEQASLDLSTAQVETLVERTEGWAAALRLVSLSLQGAIDRASVVDDFAGDDRSVADYVVDEVLSQLGRQERLVLEVASACNPIALELARVLTGDPETGNVLDHLETTTGMVTAVDRRREHYHAHELLRSHVVARMRRTRWPELSALYRRAAAWHEEHDDAAAALGFAALACDVPGTVALLRRRAVELLATGRLASLRSSERLLLDTQDAGPRVRLVLALAALESGDAARASEIVDEARQAGGVEPDDLSTLRGVVAARLASADGDPAEARTAAQRIRPEAVGETALQTLALSTRAHVRATADPEGAAHDARAALALATQHDWPFLVVQARTALARSHAYGDRLGVAVEHAYHVLDLSSLHGWRHTLWPACALAVLGLADLLAGRPEHALAACERAETGVADQDAALRSTLAVVRGAAQYDSGRELEGWRLLRAARIATAVQQYDDRQLAVAALLEQQAALGLGRVREARDVTGAVATSLPTSGDEALLQARERWSAARDPAARRLLAAVFEADSTPLAAMEALVLEAEIALAADHHSTVRRRLQDALRRADTHGIVRPLLHASAELHDFLERRRGSFGELDPLVTRILAAARHASSRPVVGLTEREREVLELLPMMRSVAEIADDLAVSVNTVKTHQRAIYHKLGAGSRRDAVVRARRLGLLVSSG